MVVHNPVQPCPIPRRMIKTRHSRKASNGRCEQIPGARMLVAEAGDTFRSTADSGVRAAVLARSRRVRPVDASEDIAHTMTRYILTCTLPTPGKWGPNFLFSILGFSRPVASSLPPISCQRRACGQAAMTCSSSSYSAWTTRFTSFANGKQSCER